ncbi:VP4 [Gokushovirus WZ-2015a]|nr:VP4 [Gokushovirus WZ-2015a]
MTCYHPLRGFPVGVTVNGKPDYLITNSRVHHVEYCHGEWQKALDERLSPYCEKVVYKYEEIPCGNCIGCRLDYSRTWADRCMLEMVDHDNSYFLTITYDDIHVPRTEYIDYDTGAIEPVMTLRKRDWQLFMKRLRKAYSKKYDNKLRFYMAGEYGDQSARPHYHAIVFGLSLDDLQFYKFDGEFRYYTSEFLQKCWTDDEGNSKGYIVVAKANWQTCAYTARYVTKKLKGKAAQFYKDYNIEPEFALMSRRPGIARNYFDEHGTALFDYDSIYLATENGSREIRPPKYFKNLLDKVDSDLYNLNKEKNKIIQHNIHYQNLKQTSQSYLDLLETQEGIKERKIKSLKRSV